MCDTKIAKQQSCSESLPFRYPLYRYLDTGSHMLPRASYHRYPIRVPAPPSLSTPAAGGAQCGVGTTVSRAEGVGSKLGLHCTAPLAS